MIDVITGSDRNLKNSATPIDPSEPSCYKGLYGVVELLMSTVCRGAARIINVKYF